MGLYILQIVILFMIFVDILYWKFSGIKSRWDKLIGLPFINIAVGTPIIFTSLTRSVFEVSKLLNVRIALLWIVTVVLLRAIINKEKLQFIKTPLNWPILAFVIVNIFSAIFASNHYITLLGAYDRWEGLITELNYMLLVFFYINYVRDRKTIFWILGSLVIGTVFSAIYGVFQYVGWDFMRWSVDPTSRVFGCINNPVHYTPYIATHIPLLIALLFYYIKKYKVQLGDFFKNYQHLIFSGLALASIILLHYVCNFLSFGRATSVAFSLAITIFLALFLARDNKEIIQDFIFVGYGCFLFNAIYVFKIWTILPTQAMQIMFSVLIVFPYLAYFMVCKNRIKLLMYSAVVLYAGFMQFTLTSLSAIFISAIAIVLLWLWIRKNFSDTAEKISVMVILILLSAVMILPSIPNLYYTGVIQKTLSAQNISNINSPESFPIVSAEVNKMVAEGRLSIQRANIFLKSLSYANAFNQGTARTSMWRTGYDMWKDAKLLGQGPGMIKEMYPKYRGADYGVLEGGHHFTPDKLHNDYVNMLATRGALGFVVYYIWLLPAGYFIILRKIRRDGFTPGNYVLLGLFAGTFVYLGQVLFNFGVVATRVIFYEFFCLAVCVALYDPFAEEITEENKCAP